MPVFPEANWADLLQMREHVRPARRKLWTALQELARNFEEDTPAGIAQDAKVHWEEDVLGKLEEVDDLLNPVKRLPSWRKFAGDGAVTTLLGVGIAASALVLDHPQLAAAEGLGVSMAGLSTLLVKEANDRRRRKEKAKFMPYWFLYEASEQFREPTWPRQEIK